MLLFFKMLLVGAVVATIFFLAYIYPNLKTPKWRRKLISAKYLRDRQHFDLADNVLEETIKKYPDQMQLYLVYKKYYSTPENMKRIFDVFKAGYEKTGLPGIGVIMADFLIEEGDVKAASELLKADGAMEFMLTNNMPLEAKLAYRMEKYADAEKYFLEFYKKLYPERNSEKEIFADFTPEELILLVQIRSHISKEWKNTIKYIPYKSLMGEDDWENYLADLRESKSKLSVVSGIYGNTENLFDYRMKNLEHQIKLITDSRVA